MKTFLIPLAAATALLASAGHAQVQEGYGFAPGYVPYYGYTYNHPAASVFVPGMLGPVPPDPGTYAQQRYPGQWQERDRDRDGVPDRLDADRDNDGVPNQYDARPNDPRRR